MADRSWTLTRRALLAGGSGAAIVRALPALAAPSAQADDLIAGLANPPADAAPWVYWYWISQNISHEGISRDLEAMARVGIGEALIGIIHEKGVSGDVLTLSDDWWAHVVHALAEGRRTGVRVGFFNTPGWSQSGGPWIKPERSMRYIASSETRVSGGRRVTLRLPTPGDHFQQVAVHAFPAPRGEGEHLRHHMASAIETTPKLELAERLLDGDGGEGCAFDPAVVGKVFVMEGLESPPKRDARGDQVVDIRLKRPFTARSLRITPLSVPIRAHLDIQYEDAGGEMVSLRKITLDRRNSMRLVGPMVYAPVALAFPATTTRRWRLVFSGVEGEAGCGLADIRFSAGALVERFVEKQLGKMHQTPTPLPDSYRWTASAEPENAFAISPEAVLDLTPRTTPDGLLEWDVPPGDWVVLRSGMLPTGVTNSPAPPAATGLEVDKMSASAVEEHFDRYVGELLRRAGDAGRPSRAVIDSYEAGPQNWTDDFADVFRARHGYDPLPWLPVLTGRVVGSADRSERFLWDVRRLVADLIAERYVGTLARTAARHGLGLWCENYGHWGFPGEHLQYAGQADRVAGEFWVGGRGKAAGLGDFETAAAVTGAHAYGKRLVSAEAFTGGLAWLGHPGALKTRGDWAFARGINHFVLHVYIHQPWNDRKPGVNAWFGTEFNRHNTWFEQSRAWIDYLRRASFLLQQGWRTAEAAVFIGEDTPQMLTPAEPTMPPGFTATAINADVILNRLTVRDGRFHLRDGGSFAVLVLPKDASCRPATLRRIAELVAAGGTVCGEPPTRSPSLSGYPDADGEVERVAGVLWRGRGRSGRVFRQGELAQALARAGARPSVLEAPEDLLWTHRTLPEGDVYFLSNQSDRPLLARPSLRARGRAVTLVDPATGVVASMPGDLGADRVRVPVELPAGGSLLVVLGPNVPDAASGSAFLSTEGLIAPPLVATSGGRSGLRWAAAEPLALNWTVRFLEGRRGELPWPNLSDWSTHADPVVRYYAGTAVYGADLDLTREQLDRAFVGLDLGRVGVIADVSVNGKPCGTVWTSPYLVDIGRAARPGRNRIEVRVTNLWYNRLVGAAVMPGGVPGLPGRPFLTATFDLGTKALEPSGLLGPVTLRRSLA